MIVKLESTSLKKETIKAVQYEIDITLTEIDLKTLQNDFISVTEYEKKIDVLYDQLRKLKKQRKDKKLKVYQKNA